MNAKRSKRAIGYCRVSTDRQANEGVSLDAQRQAVRAWATANGYNLGKLHVDAGISAKRADNRPALQAAIADACNPPAALVVYSLSRLARSVRDTINIAERLDKAGADLVSLTEKIDTTSASGKMVYRMLAVLAEFERDIVSERTKAGLAHKRANGEKLGGDVPYGFTVVEERRDNGHAVKTLQPDPTEQKGIALACRLHGRGKKLREIAATMEERGYLTKRGCRWDLGSLRRLILRSRKPK